MAGSGRMPDPVYQLLYYLPLLIHRFRRAPVAVADGRVLE